MYCIGVMLVAAPHEHEEMRVLLTLSYPEYLAIVWLQTSKKLQPALLILYAFIPILDEIKSTKSIQGGFFQQWEELTLQLLSIKIFSFQCSAFESSI